MRIEVRFYALFREIVGKRSIHLECSEECRVSDIIRKLEEMFPGLSSVFKDLGKIIILSKEGVRMSYEDIVKTDRIDVLPPSAGGSEKIIVKVVENEGISLDELLTNLQTSDTTGATTIFVGTVRSVNNGHKVRKLVYEAHETLEKFLKDIGSEIAGKYELDSVAIIHYIGERLPGDLTFIAVVNGKSRFKTFDALRELVEKVKHEAPIWKKEYREDGVYWITGNKFVRIS